MRPASLRRRSPLMAPAALAISALVLVFVSVLLALPWSSASAETQALSVTLDSSLSLTGQAVTVSVSGQTSESLVGTTLVLIVKGPVAQEQVGAAKVEAGTVKAMTWWLGAAPAGTTNTAAVMGAAGDPGLLAGKLKTAATIPGGVPSVAGAYLVVVEVRSGSKVVASGQAWLGRVAPRKAPLDVAFVLPVSLGVHRDWSGRFFDQTLEKATLPVQAGTDGLRALVPLADSLPQWRFTLAVEPILLTQLRDMADGYVYADMAGGETEVGENDLAAQNAAATVSELAALATRDSVEIVTSQYTGADLGLLAAEGWRDGLEQIQMGKQELQTSLGLSAPLAGAYAPDLSITGGSLGYYADASVDHVIVGSDVLGLFAETLDPSTVVIRAENAENDRATLVFAASEVGTSVVAPWDAGALSAAIAAELASGPRDALVIAPRDLFEPIPTDYLRQIGETLTSQQWIRTQKVQELVSTHFPGSRPVQLEVTAPRSVRYIESSLLDAVREAHGPVNDLVEAADTTKTAVDQAYRLLHVAESRWWSRDGVSAQEATMGLSYAQQAGEAARRELAKLRFVKAGAPLAADVEGTVRLTVENGTEYLVEATLRLSGEGVSFPDGEEMLLELQPGRTDVRVRVESETGSERITASLLVGSTVVDEFNHAVRFWGLWAVLPWVLAVVVLLAAGVAYVLVRRRRQKGQSARSE